VPARLALRRRRSRRDDRPIDCLRVPGSAHAPALRQFPGMATDASEKALGSFAGGPTSDKPMGSAHASEFVLSGSEVVEDG